MLAKYLLIWENKYMSIPTCPSRLLEVPEVIGTDLAKPPAGRSKTFRSYDPQQPFLLPPSLDDWLPEDDEARFISEVVEELLDLDVIYHSYQSSDGAPPYDPKMMLKILIYGYSTGVTSSREMEKRCIKDVAFRFLTANQSPDYRSIARFRRRHLKALDNLFIQVLKVCQEAGLIKLGRVALDGTKLHASASKHKAMSYDRLEKRIPEIEAEVAALLAEAERVDREEDTTFGGDRRGDEIPQELRRRESRLNKMRAAKEAIEADAREKAAQKASKKVQDSGSDEEEVEKVVQEASENAKPEPRAQRNFTDPESRIMKTNEGFDYAFNAQLVVDEKSQVIIAAQVVQDANDINQLSPMVEKTSENLGKAGIKGDPDTLLADAGYCSEENLQKAQEAGLDILIATGRLKHNERVSPSPRGPIPKNATRRELMARRLRTRSAKADYARRKAIVEPVFGQMKVKQKAGRLRLRGIEGANGEWNLHAICHNLRKLANNRVGMPVAII